VFTDVSKVLLTKQRIVTFQKTGILKSKVMPVIKQPYLIPAVDVAEWLASRFGGLILGKGAQ
jgi:hypothetical protein